MTAWKAGHLGVLRGNPRRDRRRGKLVPIDVKPKAATEGCFGKYSGTKVKIVGLDKSFFSEMAERWDGLTGHAEKTHDGRVHAGSVGGAVLHSIDQGFQREPCITRS